MLKRFFYLSVVLILLFAFAACSEEPDVPPALLSAEDFYLYQNGKLAEKLDTDHDTLVMSNDGASTWYETKRGLEVGDNATDLLTKYPGVDFSFDLEVMIDNNDDTFFDKQDRFNRYKTLKDALVGEAGLELNDQEYISVDCMQYKNAEGMFTRKQLGGEELRNKKYEDWVKNINANYDIYYWWIIIKDGKIVSWQFQFSPKGSY